MSTTTSTAPSNETPSSSPPSSSLPPSSPPSDDTPSNCTPSSSTSSSDLPSSTSLSVAPSTASSTTPPSSAASTARQTPSSRTSVSELSETYHDVIKWLWRERKKTRSEMEDTELVDIERLGVRPVVNADANASAQGNDQDNMETRTMSWIRASGLLSGDQMCLGIMAQSAALAVLGWVPGFATIVLAGVFFWFSSMTMHKSIMSNPDKDKIKNICEFTFYLSGKKNWVYWLTALGLHGNNVMLVAFHVATGAEIFNTLSPHSKLSVLFAAIIMIIGILGSMQRSFNPIAIVSTVSAVVMVMVIVLSTVAIGVEAHPGSGPEYLHLGAYSKLDPVRDYAFPQPGTTWIQCINAVTTITFLWVPQILFPSFISEMREPRDFPKALNALTGVSSIFFTIPPAIGFHYLGQYAKAPAFSSLHSTDIKKACSGMVLIPLLLIAVIYTKASIKMIHSLVMKTKPFAGSTKVKISRAAWIAITTCFWVLAFILAMIIPSMSDFLALLGSVFDSFFGFLIPAGAYFVMPRGGNSSNGRGGSFFRGPMRSIRTIIHIIMALVGLFMLGPGTYAALQPIITAYKSGNYVAFDSTNVSF